MSLFHADRRMVAALVAALLVLGVAAGAGHFSVSPTEVAEASVADITADVEPALPSPLELLAQRAEREPLDKIDSDLLETAEDSGDADLYVVVKSTSELDLGHLAAFTHHFTWPAGEHITIARVKASNLIKIASLDGVADVASGDPEMSRPLPGAPDPDLVPTNAAADPDVLRARLADAPSWAETERALAEQRALDARVGDGLNPDGWFDVGPGHAAREAWDMGYRGDGVRVGVLDTSTDFAHQDLQDTWAIMPPGTAYEGWPQVYDPYSVYLYSLELDPEAQVSYTTRAQSGVVTLNMVSDVQERDFEGEMIPSACAQAYVIRPNPDNPQFSQLVFDPETCDWKVPDSVSAGGSVKIGFHPDLYLRRLGVNETLGTQGGYSAILAADPNEAGVFDTIYVDLDGDRDFRDEKPVTKESPLSWRDIDGDQIADLSGGLLYFLADGENPVPGAYLWGIEDVIPEAGTVVAFHYDNGGHGTLCASNVVSQGRLGVPDLVDLKFRDLPNGGEPEAVNPGMAPDAELVAVGNIYSGPDAVMESAWIYAAFGSDKAAEGDELQITSNSYGFSGTDNDGLDWSSRTIDYYYKTYAPNISALFSTGNGGPGYGTLAPPSPAMGLGIAASTQMGSTGWDSITETNQITYGDITPFSNRGPGADGRTGPNVSADGAYAGGAAPINALTTSPGPPEGPNNGAYANQTWGGTSRSAPVASGHMALLYQAYMDKNGRWPTTEEAAAILMAGARFAGYDVFTMGAGVVDGGDSVRIAAGEHGIYAMPPEWSAGDYRETRHTAFPKIVHPGDTATTSITLNNPSDHDIEVTVSGQTLRRIGSYEDELTSSNLSEESPYNFLAPDYLKPIDEAQVPEGTELMIVRGRYPLDQMDPDRNYRVDNNWRLGVFRHTDWNDNQSLWTDDNGNGVVNFALLADRTHGLDMYPAIDYANSEIEPYEYIRFAYDSGETNNWDIPIHHPLERWGAGIYLGLWHRVSGNVGRTESVPQTDFSFRIDFYAYEDWDWLSTSESTVTVPAGGTQSLDVSLAVPADAAYGAYEGAVFVDYDRGENDEPVPEGAGYELPHLRTVVPVNANVAAEWTWEGQVVFGGDEARDMDDPYNNGVVRGEGDWGWRPEAGDWRFFWLDATEPPLGAQWIVRTMWDDPVGKTDIDTHLYGPGEDRFSAPIGSDDDDEDMYDPDYYGPYTLERKGGSNSAYIQQGRWAYNTSTNENEDWFTAAGEEGLHEILLHNVLFSGDKFDVPFETVVASASLNPNVALVREGMCTDVDFVTGIELAGFEATAYGMAMPDLWEAYEIPQDDPNDESSASFKETITVTEQTGGLMVDVSGDAGVDLDLFLVRDGDGDGVFTNQEIVSSSTTPTAMESITVWTPMTGTYQVWVQGWSVPMTTTARIEIKVFDGDSLTVERDAGEVVPNQPNTLEVCVADGETLDPSAYGIVLMGPAASPTFFQLPVRPVTDMIYLPVSKRERE